MHRDFSLIKRGEDNKIAAQEERPKVGWMLEDYRPESQRKVKNSM